MSNTVFIHWFMYFSFLRKINKIIILTKNDKFSAVSYSLDRWFPVSRDPRTVKPPCRNNRPSTATNSDWKCL